MTWTSQTSRVVAQSGATAVLLTALLLGSPSRPVSAQTQARPAASASAAPQFGPSTLLVTGAVAQDLKLTSTT
jgi:hypothetical protein